ncbi:flavin reductase family protein [Bradyrhizobium sp. RDT10]
MLQKSQYAGQCRGNSAAGFRSTPETGAPVLADSAAAFDCRIIDVANVDKHGVPFCRVVAALQRSDCADSLIYFCCTTVRLVRTDSSRNDFKGRAGPRSRRRTSNLSPGAPALRRDAGERTRCRRWQLGIGRRRHACALRLSSARCVH